MNHPGEILQEQLDETSMSAEQLATHLNVSKTLVAAFIAGECDMTVDLAIRLSKFYQTGSDFWTNLQANYNKSKLFNEYVKIKSLEDLGFYKE